MAGPTPFGAEMFKLLYPKLRKMTAPDQPEVIQALGIGAMAEFAVQVEHVVKPVAAEMIKVERDFVFLLFFFLFFFSGLSCIDCF